MGSFCKSLTIGKIIAYAFNNVLLNWSINKENLRAFWVNPYLLLLFDVHYIRVFCKFPWWSLLWTTILTIAVQWWIKLYHDNRQVYQDNYHIENCYKYFTKIKNYVGLCNNRKHYYLDKYAKFISINDISIWPSV